MTGIRERARAKFQCTSCAGSGRVMMSVLRSMECKEWRERFRNKRAAVMAIDPFYAN